MDKIKTCGKEVIKAGFHAAVNGTAAGINEGLDSGLIPAFQRLGKEGGNAIVPGAGGVLGGTLGFLLASGASIATGAVSGSAKAMKSTIVSAFANNTEC